MKNRLLAEQSSTDGLTRVKNHRALIEHLNAEINYISQIKKPLSIAIFDLDDFKKINDSKGHIYGDKVLFDIAKIMQDNIRQSDMVGRYGGEEFLIIFAQTDISIAKTIAERIRKAVQQYHFDNNISITISGGVKEYTSGGVADFIHEADINLYEAKKQGKNRII